MALNPFFLQGSSNEQFLVQDLINEQLKIYGIDIYYLPRKVLSVDSIIRDVETSKFDDSFLIEAYLDNYEGYAPGSDIMTKYGLRLKNEINLVISKERFEEFISPFLVAIEEGLKKGILDGENSNYDLNTVTRPLEGDLIYFPLGERLFEIKRVEFEKPFYQLGRNYVYELQCELYEYENEEINTSIDEVDSTVEDEGYITTLRLINSSVRTATAEATITSGAVNQVFINDDGSGYTGTPTVTISPPQLDQYGNIVGEQATAVAITTSVGNIQSIKRIEITNGGSGYTSPPTITITGGNGIGAAATCSIGGTLFSVSKLEITDPGSGYSGLPTVTISDPTSGITATAIARVNSRFEIESLRILNGGSGYTSVPTVTFQSLGSAGIGTFVYNETITGQTSGTTAKIKDFRPVEAQQNEFNPPIDAQVYLNTGTFYPGEVVVGSISGATYTVQNYDRDSYEDPYDSNEEIELEADSILDFTESNPFGEY